MQKRNESNDDRRKMSTLGRSHHIPNCHSNGQSCKRQYGHTCQNIEEKPVSGYAKIDHCFEYKRHKDYVEVKFNEDCHKNMKHVACSYNDDKGEENLAHHMYSDSDKDRYFSFHAPCKAKEIKWYFEDGYYRNKDAPKCAWEDDACYHKYFMGGKVCDQCGRYKVKIPDCKKDGKDD